MANRETIHSGHFMASNVHGISLEEEEEIDVVSDGRLPAPEVTPDAKDEKPVTFYKFGPQTTRSIAIDTSLLKLNRCIQTAYAQLITPKWKNFKGLKLVWKERIRLNNVIWRAWHAQFVRNAQPKFCFFSVPEEDWHNQTEAAGVMEGIYWKRRNETVCAQYKRWRHFFYKRSSKLVGRRVRSTSMRHSNSDEDALLLPLPSLTPLSGLDDDDWNNWFTDTLFSSLGQPYLFPNPKEMAQAGNADFIQPGLVQLQPSLEEIMASLENDGPYNNDPGFSGASNNFLERMNSMNGSSSINDDPSLESLRNSANHYTSKDYAAASLLVEYSNSLAGHSGAGASQAGCSSSSSSSADFGKRSGNSSSSSLRNEFCSINNRSSSLSNNCNNQIYGRSSCSSPRDSNSVGASLNDPYVPQLAKLATSETIGSQQMQYTLAKTWLGDNGNGNGQAITSSAGGGYDYGNNQGASSINNAYSPMATTIRLLKSDPCLPRPPLMNNRRGKHIDRIDTVASPTPKRGRPNAKKSAAAAEAKQTKKNSVDVPISAVRGPVSVASTAPTVVGMIGSGYNERDHSRQQTPIVAQRKGSGGATTRKSSGGAGGVSTASSKRRSSSSSVNDMKQSSGLLTLTDFDYPRSSVVVEELPRPKSILETSTPASELIQIQAQSSSTFCTLAPLVIQQPNLQQQQQMGVVRPIPISLARADSAFSTISPLGFSPPSNMSISPMQQRSPAGSSTPSSSLDYSKSLVCGNDIITTASVVNSGQTSQLIYGASNASVTQSSGQQQVLILQPFGGMQFPIMALPYSNSGASYATTIPKQEPDKILMNSYDPESYASPTNDIVMRSPSQRPIAQRAANQEALTVLPSKKTAKRPADSTLDPSERKRVQHLHAEQTRRSALKGGFELLEDLLPEFSSTNTKPTNALVLLKSAERLRELKSALPNNEMEVFRLKAEIQQMNEKISNYQKQLTVSGKSASKVGMFQHMLDNYVKQRTQQSWQFWLMKKILDPLTESYKTEVQGTNREELLTSAVQWARKRCTKEEMRPVVNGLLIQLGVETPLLKDPASFRKYVQEQMDK